MYNSRFCRCSLNFRSGSAWCDMICLLDCIHVNSFKPVIHMHAHCNCFPWLATVVCEKFQLKVKISSIPYTICNLWLKFISGNQNNKNKCPIRPPKINRTANIYTVWMVDHQLQMHRLVFNVPSGLQKRKCLLLYTFVQNQWTFISVSKHFLISDSV